MKKHEKWYALSGFLGLTFIAILVTALFMPSTWIVMAAIATLVAGVLSSSKGHRLDPAEQKAKGSFVDDIRKAYSIDRTIVVAPTVERADEIVRARGLSRSRVMFVTDPEAFEGLYWTRAYVDARVLRTNDHLDLLFAYLRAEDEHESTPTEVISS